MLIRHQSEVIYCGETGQSYNSKQRNAFSLTHHRASDFAQPRFIDKHRTNHEFDDSGFGQGKLDYNVL